MLGNRCEHAGYDASTTEGGESRAMIMFQLLTVSLYCGLLVLLLIERCYQCIRLLPLFQVARYSTEVATQTTGRFLKLSTQQLTPLGASKPSALPSSLVCHNGKDPTKCWVARREEALSVSKGVSRNPE